MDRQTLACVFIQDRQYPQSATTFGAGFQKIIGPHFVGATGTAQMTGESPKRRFPVFRRGNCSPSCRQMRYTRLRLMA